MSSTRTLPVLILMLVAGGMLGCDTADKEAAKLMTRGGDPDRGRSAIDSYGCSGCHTIPGVRGADALVGPPLTSFGERAFVGGVMKNTPDNLIRWIQDAPGVDPMTAMPNVHVKEADARDIASYLYTLR